MKKAIVLAVLFACSPAAAPAPVVEVTTQPAVDAGTQVTSLPPAPPPDTVKTCNDDDASEYDCSALPLAQCSAAEYYACPRKSKLPEGVGFRPKIALNIAQCMGRPDFSCADIGPGIKQVEACVRESVKKTCVDPKMVELCEKELGTCPKDTVDLCGKLLSSLGDKTRKSAIEDLHSQRRGNSCHFSWDLNGFPFCPYCPFTDH